MRSTLARWWESELFSGKPAWETLLAFLVPRLTPEDQSFLDNECETLCCLVDDWEAMQVYQGLSSQAWQYVKDKGFLGMIIQRRYDGLEFSAYALRKWCKNFPRARLPLPCR